MGAARYIVFTGETVKLRKMASKPPLSEEEFASSEVLFKAAKSVNFVWLLAEFHRRPAARRFLDQLAQALAPHVKRQANSG